MFAESLITHWRVRRLYLKHFIMMWTCANEQQSKKTQYQFCLFLDCLLAVQMIRQAVGFSLLTVTLQGNNWLILNQ